MKDDEKFGLLLYTFLKMEGFDPVTISAVITGGSVTRQKARTPPSAGLTPPTE